MDHLHAETEPFCAEDSRRAPARAESTVGALSGTNRKTAEAEDRTRLQATQIAGKFRSFDRLFASVVCRLVSFLL